MIHKIEALIAKSQEYAKLIAYLATALLVIGAQFIPVEYKDLISGIVAAIGAYAVYAAPARDGRHEAK